ncbi:hypothetical protein ACJJIF_05145 [Microbulbifer sp. SSSA002]|uniref:hypothetical protein n=1 Tax=Microbulbifer sp. SSSA002 TaxID=3243376 RepID=UPI004039146D
MKEIQGKLKKRSEEIFKNGPDFDEPQSTGDPSRIFEEDEQGNDTEDPEQSP